MLVAAEMLEKILEAEKVAADKLKQAQTQAACLVDNAENEGRD